MTRILVVDDEPQLSRALVINLAARGYEVATAATVRSAIAELGQRPPDIVVLDLGLPDGDGAEVITHLRTTRPTLPVVVLSARAGSQDKVHALDLGAVDYVTKPFDMNELVARIRAAIRRSAGQFLVGSVVQLGGLTVDLDGRTVTRPTGDTIRLTPTEWGILDVLLRHPGRLVSSKELLTAVRNDPAHTDSSYLRIYLRQMRNKLEPEPARPRHLLTEPGMGYRFQP